MYGLIHLKKMLDKNYRPEIFDFILLCPCSVNGMYVVYFDQLVGAMHTWKLYCKCSELGVLGCIYNTAILDYLLD